MGAASHACHDFGQASYSEEEIRDFRRAFDEFDVDHSDAPLARSHISQLLKVFPWLHLTASHRSSLQEADP